ncbi:MAG: MlaD family protein [Paludibacteraceae bacterium]|nr:MlaD family protein [Paludibacteraceae bacterium]
MKKIAYWKEIRVSILFLLAVVLLYYGMYFLKGINLFHKTNTYITTFQNTNGLVEQNNVYIHGYKVGIVDKILYDFSSSTPFVVHFSTNTDIQLPQGTVVTMIADGLLGGTALELRFPDQMDEADLAYYHCNDTLPSKVEEGMVSSLMGMVSNLSSKLDPILVNLDSLSFALRNNLTDEQMAQLVRSLNSTLRNTQAATGKLDKILAVQVPQLMDSIQLVVCDVHRITNDVAEANLRATILKLDTTVNGVNQFMDKVNSTDGTIGMLLNDKNLYINLNNTVTSADSLISDLKANPKRYVQFSLFGK